MYIVYKRELEGIGFEYEVNTTFGDSFLLIQYLDGMCEIFFYDKQERKGSILLDSNETSILSRLLNREKL
ncbi:hypothetical protein ACS127_13830 [Amphibacillus sp. Q70]|uniref:hypothetical protein n=1 Tax=Amphibacillus sp. Q70 TaxID=3453416 RepID=UPI003F8721CD